MYHKKQNFKSSKSHSFVTVLALFVNLLAKLNTCYNFLVQLSRKYENEIQIFRFHFMSMTYLSGQSKLSLFKGIDRPFGWGGGRG
jgi:hypothetical protein